MNCPVDKSFQKWAKNSDGTCWVNTANDSDDDEGNDGKSNIGGVWIRMVVDFDALDGWGSVNST